MSRSSSICIFISFSYLNPSVSLWFLCLLLQTISYQSLHFLLHFHQFLHQLLWATQLHWYIRSDEICISSLFKLSTIVVTPSLWIPVYNKERLSIFVIVPSPYCVCIIFTLMESNKQNTTLTEIVNTSTESINLIGSSMLNQYSKSIPFQKGFDFFVLSSSHGVEAVLLS